MNNLFYPKLFSLYKSGILKQQITKDILSGIVVGIVALPLAIAFAVASGVSPEKGLITAVLAGLIVSIFGGSRVQIAGPTGAFVIIIYQIIEQYGTGGLIISTILAGIMLIAFGLLNLGSLLKFFPHPLIVGFTSGIAVVILSTQVKDALGLTLSSIPSEFIEKWWLFISNISHTNYWALGITLSTILIITLTKKISDKIPGSFVAIILITLAVQLFSIPVPTISTYFSNLSGNFAISMPKFDFSNIQHYFAPALTIALLGAIESLLSAVVSDGMIGSKHRSNTELIAQGLANIVVPLFGGIPATGAIARTATNVKNGGRTPIAGIVHSIVLLLIMLFLGSWAKLIPMACLAGILIVVAYNMSEWRSFKTIMMGPVFDRFVLLATFFLTVLVDLTVAIEVGIVLSALLFMKRMSDIADKKVEELPDSDTIEDYSYVPDSISIYEIGGPLFFGAAKTYTQVIEQFGIKSDILIIRMRKVPFVDQTGIYNLKSTLKLLKKHNVLILFSGVNQDVRNDFERCKITDLIPNENIYALFDDAIKFAIEKVNKINK